MDANPQRPPVGADNGLKYKKLSFFVKLEFLIQKNSML
jgi:hypothetical protein